MNTLRAPECSHQRETKSDGAVGFQYKSNIVWYKVRKDGGPDRRGVGFYFRNVTELCLFGIRGKNNRTLTPGRTQPNVIVSRKREHSRKPDEMYDIVEQCSPGPHLEMFARHTRPGWLQWGNEVGAPKAKQHRGYSSKLGRREVHDPTSLVLPTSSDHVAAPLYRFAKLA